MTQAPERRRGGGTTAITVILTLLGANALVQVAMALFGANSDPALLRLLQLVSGLLAVIAAWGTWHRRRWAAWCAFGYGAWTGAMILALGAILELAPDERTGLVFGAVAVLGVGAALAWGIARTQRSRTGR
jgi:hypothetical protein